MLKTLGITQKRTTFFDLSSLGERKANKMEPENDRVGRQLGQGEPTRSLDSFFALVRDSLEGQAKRKGYNETGPDAENKLYEFTKHIGASAGHSIGEIIYKATEYMKQPREVLLIKIAAWAYLEWKYFR